MMRDFNLDLATKIGMAVAFAILVLVVFCLTQMIEDPAQFNSVGGIITK